MDSKIKQRYLENKRKKKLKISSYVNVSDDIAISILNALAKVNMSRTEFAKRLGKQPSVISKWFNGQHNFTVKTIVDIENVLNQKIIFPANLIKQEDSITKSFIILNFDSINKNDFSKLKKTKSNKGEKVTLSSAYSIETMNFNT